MAADPNHEAMYLVLRDAVLRLLSTLADVEQTSKTLRVPLPRPRTFRFTEKACWPATSGIFTTNVLSHKGMFNLSGTQYGRVLADYIIEEVAFRPKGFVRALRRVQACAAWLEARADGLQRQKENNDRAQKRYLDIIQSEAAAIALRNAGDDSDPIPF